MISGGNQAVRQGSFQMAEATPPLLAARTSRDAKRFQFLL
jgi:hypothetical protein